jgi:putative acetyltransferase
MFGLRGRMVTIRPEKPDDIATVRAVNKTAFGQLAEAEIVDSLRTAFPDAVSLVAVENSTIVGHIFFSPVVVSGEKNAIRGMGLTPMAVLPHHQPSGHRISVGQGRN